MSQYSIIIKDVMLSRTVFHNISHYQTERERELQRMVVVLMFWGRGAVNFEVFLLFDDDLMLNKRFSRLKKRGQWN